MPGIRIGNLRKYCSSNAHPWPRGRRDALGILYGSSRIAHRLPRFRVKANWPSCVLFSAVNGTEAEEKKLLREKNNPNLWLADIVMQAVEVLRDRLYYIEGCVCKSAAVSCNAQYTSLGAGDLAKTSKIRPSNSISKFRNHKNRFCYVRLPISKFEFWDSKMTIRNSRFETCKFEIWKFEKWKFEVWDSKNENSKFENSKMKIRDSKIRKCKLEIRILSFEK